MDGVRIAKGDSMNEESVGGVGGRSRWVKMLCVGNEY
jgi:hypothetical protein